MWLTNGTAGKLEGAMRKLFTNALDIFVDVDKGNDFDTMGPLNGHDGIFARLAVPDKYLVLRHVAKALLTKSPAPFKSAMLESAIYAIFCNNADIWESDTPEEVAEHLIDYYMENERFADWDLPEDFPATPSREDVLKVLTKHIQTYGAKFYSDQLADSILSDRDFELPPLAPGDPRFRLMDIDPQYWSAGPTQLKELRKEARDKGESFGVVYWDLKAVFLTTGFPLSWAAIRSEVMRLEHAAPEALTRPKLKKHINCDLSSHVDSLLRVTVRAKPKSTGVAAAAVSGDVSVHAAAHVAAAVSGDASVHAAAPVAGVYSGIARQCR